MGLDKQANFRAFLLLCVLLVPVIFSACSSEKQVVKAQSLYVREIPGGLHNIEPIRGEVRPLAFLMEGDAYPCSMCHEGFTGESTQAALEGQHANIEFNHGRNLRCLNCHSPTNSDAYVDHDGSEISGDTPNLLCAKCHGPHYREWELGVHGRRNGYWSQQMGEQARIACVQCHNPHHPVFPLMEPMPPHELTRFADHPTQVRGEAAHVE